MHRTLAILALSAPAALAHATFEQTEVTRNTVERFVVRIPHGCGAEPTLRLRVAIPHGLVGVQPMPKGGWDLDTVHGSFDEPVTSGGREITEGVQEIVWEGELRTDFYDEFVFRARITEAVPAGEMLWIPVVQECETAAERWIELPGPDQSPADLSRPAPGVMVLPAADDDHGHGHSHGHSHGD